jgi:ABC-type transporter Mla subunit MlaD
LQIGEWILSAILWSAQLLVQQSASGWVAGGFFCSLGAFCVWTLLQYTRRIGAVRGLSGHIERCADGQAFTRQFDELNAELQTWSAGAEVRRAVFAAWEEYAETTVLDTRDGQTIRRNAVRPTNFLNVEDLGFGPGFFRMMPGMFVSLGLLCTFLGLVAALSKLGHDLGQGAKPEEVVTGLMIIASAKFVMSLAGLACSIIFGLWLRVCQARLDKALHGLCLAIERRLSFVSLEDLGFRQLEAAVEQREAFRKIGMELVADLKRPLDALPHELSQSIVTAMAPVFEQAGRLGTSSMEGIVGDLSSQISSSVGLALTRASDSLQDASERIGALVDRMNASTAQMGDGMQTALAQMASAIADLRTQVAATGEVASSTMTEGAERLLSVMNETLKGIRDNTAEGAGAMSRAAEEMRGAADGFREALSSATDKGASAVEQRMREASNAADSAISGAGQAMLAAFGKTTAEIAQVGAEMSATIGSQLIERLNALARQFEALVGEVTDGVGNMRSASTSLRSGADAIAGAAVSFGGASRELVAATDPVRAAHERIETAIRQLVLATSETSATMSASAQSVARNAAQVLETAQTALGNEREGIRQTMEATRATLAQLTREAEKLDNIDAMLGRALAGYSAQLEAALGSAQEHIVRMKETLAPGIDTLRGVVERAESFMPRSGRLS